MKQIAATKPLLAAVLLLAAMSPLNRASAAEAPASLFTVDYKSLVSRADLTYAKPVDRSEEGLPVGNGRMGSLVWTTPDALKFQLNRVDVFAAGCNTRAFPRAGRPGRWPDLNAIGCRPRPKATRRCHLRLRQSTCRRD